MMKRPNKILLLRDYIYSAEIIEKKVSAPTPTPTPIPIIKKTKAEIDQYWECKETDNACSIALGNSNDTYVVTGNKSYEIELYFTSGYEPGELLVDVDYCYPLLLHCKKKELFY